MDLEQRIVKMFGTFTQDGLDEIGSLLSRCRFKLLSDGSLEVAGNREFYKVMRNPGELRTQVLQALEEHFGVDGARVTAVYLPSALAQHIPDWRERLD